MFSGHKFFESGDIILSICYVQKLPPEELYEERCSLKFQIIQRKTPKPVSFLIKLQALDMPY